MLKFGANEIKISLSIGKEKEITVYSERPDKFAEKNHEN